MKPLAIALLIGLPGCASSSLPPELEGSKSFEQTSTLPDRPLNARGRGRRPDRQDTSCHLDPGTPPIYLAAASRARAWLPMPPTRH